MLFFLFFIFSTFFLEKNRKKLGGKNVQNPPGAVAVALVQVDEGVAWVGGGWVWVVVPPAVFYPPPHPCQVPLPFLLLPLSGPLADCPGPASWLPGPALNLIKLGVLQCCVWIWPCAVEVVVGKVTFLSKHPM